MKEVKKPDNQNNQDVQMTALEYGKIKQYQDFLNTGNDSRFITFDEAKVKMEAKVK